MKKIILMIIISITSLLLSFVNAATPYIVTNEGIGQYGYIEKDASPTYFRLSSADYGNIYQLFARSWISTNILTYGAAPNTCATIAHSTSNFNFGTLSAGNTIYSSVHADYCGGGNSYGGNPNQAGFNERSFFVMDVAGKTDALVSTVYYSLSNLNVVLTFTISNGNTPSQIFNRLWIVNEGTAIEGTDINNDAFDLYYEDATGSETFNGTESHTTLYGDYNSNSTSNNVYGNDALNISIPQNITGGLRCYVVLKGTSTYLNSTAKGKNVKTSIIVDGISITPNRDAYFSLLKMDKITPSENAITISDEYITVQTGNWNTSATWMGGSIPPLSAKVTIDHSITMDANFTVNSLTINSTKSLSVAAGNQLTVSTTLTNNGTLNLLSDATGTATILTPTTISGSGTANVQQYLTSGRNWYISSPVAAATSNVLAADATNPLYYYVETVPNTWSSITNTTTELVLMKGYVAKISSERSVTFTGALNTGPKSISTLTSSGASFTGYNLVGNPYPSYVNWNNATKTNVGTSIWYRSKSTGVYLFQTYNSSGSASTNGGSAIIPPMQAFWVNVTSGTGTVGFTNEDRSHQDQSIATNRLKAPAVISQQLLRLQVSNSVNADEAVIYFDANAQNGYDVYDSKKMTNNSDAIPEIFTTIGSDKLVINGMNSLPLDTEIPIGFKTLKKGITSFNIQVSELSNFDSDTGVFLKDNQNISNILHDITNGTPYTFTSDSLTTENRFSIIFRSAGATTNLNQSINNENILIHKNSNNLVSVVCSNQDNSGLITIYDTLGQRLVTKKIAGNSTVIDTPFQSGVYVVSVTNRGKSITKKIIFE